MPARVLIEAHFPPLIPLNEFAAGALPPSRDELDEFYAIVYWNGAGIALGRGSGAGLSRGPRWKTSLRPRSSKWWPTAKSFRPRWTRCCQAAADQGIFPDVESQAGYDFYQTRVGAGVGFWETDDWPEPYGPKLDAAAKAFGNVDFYVGDDNLIYQSGAEGDWQLRSLTPKNAKGGLIGSVKVTDTEPPADPDAPTFTSINNEEGDDDEDLRESAGRLVAKLLAEDEWEGDAEAEDVLCPICQAMQPDAQARLGALGNRVHYRCRYCGGDWSASKNGPAWGDSPGD